MSELARQSGCESYTVTDTAGKTWRLSSVETGSAAGELDDFAVNRYREQVQTMAAGMPADVWGAALASAAGKINAGQFKFGGPGMADLMQQDEYRTRLVWLMLRPAHPDATEAHAKQLLRERVREVYAAIAALNPNTFGASTANGAADQKKAKPSGANRSPT